MEYVPHLVFIFGYATLAFFLSVSIAPFYIRLLKRFKCGKTLREHATTGEQAVIFNGLHQKKAGVPTLGGVLVWGTVLLVVLFSRFLSLIGVIDASLLQRTQTWLPLFTLLVAAVLGLVDDWFNLKSIGKTKGLSVKPKFIWLTLFALAGALWFYFKLEWQIIHIPRFGDFEIGLWYIPLFMFVILGTANAVNITDGLDGLAGGLLAIAFTAFAIIAYADGQLHLTAFCAVIVGALTGFLWFNVPPAKFFMGDTGAISLGATLGVIAMLTDAVVALVVIGGVFVFETISSSLQMFWKKVFKKKLFLIAPFHHHLEALGWPESNVVMRLWIVGAILALIGVIFALVGSGIS